MTMINIQQQQWCVSSLTDKNSFGLDSVGVSFLWAMWRKHASPLQEKSKSA
jgi:hypothetical protein